jgi:hypothetical protein
MADRAANMPGTEGSGLLTQNERAQRDGTPHPQRLAADATSSWHSRSACPLLSGSEPIDHVEAAAVADFSGFSRRTALVTSSQSL